MLQPQAHPPQHLACPALLRRLTPRPQQGPLQARQGAAISSHCRLGFSEQPTPCKSPYLPLRLRLRRHPAYTGTCTRTRTELIPYLQ